MNRTITADFEIIDLCVLNSDGECHINPDVDLPPQITNILPKGLEKKIEDLRLFFKNRKSLVELVNNSPLDFNPDQIDSHAISAFSFSTEGETMLYPLRRVCRIRGSFNRLISQYYWDYRGRIDLNEINLTRKRRVTYTLEAGFPKQSERIGSLVVEVESSTKFLEIGHIRDLLIGKSKLIESLPNTTHSISGSSFKENNTGIVFDFVKGNTLKATIPLVMADGRRIDREQITIKEILGKKPEGNNILISAANETLPINNAKGYPNKFPLSQLSTGFEIVEEKIQVEFIDGCFSIITESDNEVE